MTDARERPARYAPTQTAATKARATTQTPAVAVATAAKPATPAVPFTLSIGFGPAVAIGLGPRASGLGRLFASGRLGSFSLELGGDAAWPATQQQTGSAGFTLDRFAADAAACGHAGPLAACVTTAVGYLRARGFGVDAPASPAGLFSQVGARLAATRELGGRYFAAAHIDGLVMTAPWTVTINQTAVWTTPRASALLGLDLGAHFF